MKIAAFLQNRNGVDNGFLAQCLESMSRTTDQIFVYDDASDQPVKPIYDRYQCVVIYGQTQGFQRELFHKEQLLRVALRSNPDWILWFDSDAILGRHFEYRDRTVATLEEVAANQIDLLFLHNLNLWRSPRWFRVDQKFNDLWHGVFWRNTGELHYQPRVGLHQQQFPFVYHDHQRPVNGSKFEEPSGQLLHFGFASEEEIARKYFTYRSHGQKDWALNRLVDESAFILEPAPPDWFPTFVLEGLMAQDREEPEPMFDHMNMAGLSSLEAWHTEQQGQRADAQTEGALQL